MSSALAAPYISVEEYLRGDYEPACEYVDGVLEPKPMGDKKHSALQTELIFFLRGEAIKFSLWVRTELHMRTAARRFRIPDVAVFAYPVEGERFAENAPLFTIEVLSPEESLKTLRAKIADQLSMGTSLVIVADPHSRTVYTARPGLGFHEVAPPLTVSIDVPERGTLAIDFDELFRLLD